MEDKHTGGGRLVSFEEFKLHSYAFLHQQTQTRSDCSSYRSCDSSFIPPVGWKVMSLILMHLQPAGMCQWHQLVRRFCPIEEAEQLEEPIVMKKRLLFSHWLRPVD